MHLPPRGSKRALCLMLFLATVACRSDRSSELRRLVPRLSPEMASHLMNDDAEQFQRFVGQTSRYLLVDAFWSLAFAPPTDSLPEFVRVETFVKPSVWRLVDPLDRPNRTNLARAYYEAYSRHSAEDRIEIIRLAQSSRTFWRDTTSVEPRAETRAETLLQLIDRGKRYADVLNLASYYGIYASLLSQLGRQDEISHYLQLGLEAALAYPDSDMACQLLGALGAHDYHAGNFEEMRRSWDRALALARASGSWHEARILSFYSDYYRSQGQLAIARDLVLEAQDRCRELGAVEIELRCALDALQFFASLDCWDAVGRGLRRAEMVHGESRRYLPQEDAELEETRLQVLHARYCAATGRCEEAQELARTVVSHIDHWSLGTSRTARIRLDAARALATCGLASSARGLLEQGLQQGLEEDLVGDYANELAEANLALGELDAAQRILDAHPDTTASRESVRHGILQLRLAMLRHDRPAASNRLQAALQLLDAMEGRLGASPEAYIALAATDELRRLGHELLDDSAEAGYAFEMRWRRPVGLGPRFSGPLASEPAFVSSLVAETKRAQGRLAARDAVHCIYDIRDAEVVRFTADGRGVQEERLACSPAALRILVNRVCGPLGAASPSTDGLDPSRAKDLRQLATWLLPESLRGSVRCRLFLVTTNGCLARLPFETLNVDAQGYVPLLDRVDVASIRLWRDGEPPRGDTALVVSGPVYPASLRRRYSILTEGLPVCADEATCALRLLPRSVGLVGAAANKRNVVERWQRARMLYFAGHSVQDPELPYAMFIPVSESPHGRDSDCYLEVADVRNTDLSRCRLVVLSSCASGAPYLDGNVVVPSLADVFVDAGARAVVSTGWAVRDEDAARIMTSFMRLYAADENDPIGALCRARREMAAVTKDPHIWAAYSITLGGLSALEVGPVVGSR